MFNCVPTIEAICMLVTIYLRSASQQCLVVALTTLPTIESHMVPYKYTRKAFQQFPCTLAGDSPKWNILVVTRALVIGICDLPEIYTLALGLCPRARVYISGKSLVPMLQLLHIFHSVGAAALATKKTPDNIHADTQVPLIGLLKFSSYMCLYNSAVKHIITRY